MSELVERLRNWTEVYPEEAGEAEGSLYEKAADEIERLRAALRDIRDMGPVTIDDQRWRIAKNALEAGNA